MEGTYLPHGNGMHNRREGTHWLSCLPSCLIHLMGKAGQGRGPRGVVQVPEVCSEVRRCAAQLQMCVEVLRTA